MGVIIPVGFGLAEIPFRLVGDNEEMIVTLGFQDNQGVSANNAATLIQTATFNMASFAASAIPTVYSVGPVRVTVGTILGPQEGVATGSRTGTNAASPPLPQNNAVLVSKRTARGGRAGRGRMYFPPFIFNEGIVSATGVITQSFVDQFQGEINAWHTALNAANVPPYLLHSEAEVGEPQLPPDQILAFTVRNIVATQRTRLRR